MKRDSCPCFSNCCNPTTDGFLTLLVTLPQCSPLFFQKSPTRVPAVFHAFSKPIPPGPSSKTQDTFPPRIRVVSPSTVSGTPYHLIKSRPWQINQNMLIATFRELFSPETSVTIVHILLVQLPSALFRPILVFPKKRNVLVQYNTSWRFPSFLNEFFYHVWGGGRYQDFSPLERDSFTLFFVLIVRIYSKPKLNHVTMTDSNSAC